jgi:hypothetical protein
MSWSIWTHNGCVTIKSPTSGNHRTFRVRTQAKDAEFAPGERVLGLLTGPDNEWDFDNFAFVKTNPNRIVLWKRFRGNGPHEVYVDMLSHPDKWTERGVTYTTEGRCRRCNRKLTVPESVQAGIGPVCATHENEYETEQDEEHNPCEG